MGARSVMLSGSADRTTRRYRNRRFDVIVLERLVSKVGQYRASLLLEPSRFLVFCPKKTGRVASASLLERGF